MEKIFGGSPLAVLVRLIVISIVVGIVLSTLGWSPFDFFTRLQTIVIGLWNKGFDAFGSVGRWFVAGAIVVFPIWILLRLLGLAKGSSGPRPPGSLPPRSPSPFKDRS